MKGKSKMFCTKCGAKLPDQAKFCTSCCEPVNNPTPEKQNKNSKLIWAAIVVVVILFIIIAACNDTGEASGDNTTENTLQSEEIMVSDTPTSPEPDTEPAPTETTIESDESKYPKTYNDKGELIVYWLDSGSVWHESAKCSTVINADASKLHAGSANEAYSSGKSRACKTCSADSTVVIPENTKAPETTPIPETPKSPETTKAPETTSAPETTKTPETTNAPETTIGPETSKIPETTVTPETTKIPETTDIFSDDLNSNITIYWFDAGNVWHFSLDCWTLKNIPTSILHQGLPKDAFIAGMTRACKACADGTTIDPYETTATPEVTNTPETTVEPDITSTSDDTRIVFWVTEGYVWHYNRKCRTLDKTEDYLIYSGYVSEAKAIGKERACKVCADGSTIVSPDTTIESEITTVPETTFSPDTDNEELIIISWPETASRNEIVSVSIRGKANTKYHIEVNYKSGLSTSNDLAPQISNSNGEVTWTWKVGARSTAGTFDITVKDDYGNSVTVKWTVVVD